MNQLGNIVIGLLRAHKRGILFGTVVLVSGSMLFKGFMQRPQINRFKAEIADYEAKKEEELNRQAEIDDLESKVNTDEYIEKIASEKLGLVKSNSKIFLDVSDED